MAQLDHDLLLSLIGLKHDKFTSLEQRDIEEADGQAAEDAMNPSVSATTDFGAPPHINRQAPSIWRMLSVTSSFICGPQAGCGYGISRAHCAVSVYCWNVTTLPSRKRYT